MPAHAVTLRQYCSGILGSGDLESKLTPPVGRDGQALDDTHPGDPVYISHPRRDHGITMNSGVSHLPKPSSISSPAIAARCLAGLAHHELSASEIYAWALLRWPDLPSELRSGFAQALADEQEHCRRYLARMHELGVDFTSFRHANQFWRYLPAIEASPHGPRAFLAVVGLTLEQANLDRTLSYRDAFLAAGDEASAKVLQAVHDDAVNHVGLAASWIRRLGPPGADTIEAYCEAVPYPLSATKARGKHFDVTGRRRAGLEESFIDYVRKSQRARRSARKTNGVASRSSGVAQLYPNIGAEELPGKGGVVVTTATLPTLRLWRLLFEPASEFMVPVAPTESRKLIQCLSEPWWPESLGPQSKSAAFSWLDNACGITPWIASARVQAHPTYYRQTIRSAPPGVVARVHDKAFAHRITCREELMSSEIAELPLVLEPGDLAQPESAIARMSEQVADWPEWAKQSFTLKPRLGTSGRGRVPGANGAPDTPAVRGALKRMLRKGGAILEPWFERTSDLSAQIHIASDGKITLLGSLEQIVAPSGVYLGHRGEIDSRGRVFSGSCYEEELRDAAAVAARCAFQEGFSGPCGIDAFSLRVHGENGSERVLLRPLVEFNARFTLGTIAIGLVRRALDQVRQAIDLSPGVRRAFLFSLKAPEGGWEAALAGVPGRTKFISLAHPDDEIHPGMIFAESLEALDSVVELIRTRPRRG